MIVKSGKWNGTKSKLMAMDIKQVRAIFYKIRNEQMNGLMKFDKNISDNTNTQQEVNNDRPNNDVRSS